MLRWYVASRASPGSPWVLDRLVGGFDTMRAALADLARARAELPSGRHRVTNEYAARQ